MIHAEDLTIELEGEEKVDTVVAGLRYTGDASTQPPRRPRDSGGWPGRASFQGAQGDDDAGPIQIGVIPDRIDGDYVEGGTLPGLENLPDFEVVYDPAELAEAILKENYLPPSVFGGPQTAPDYEVRERVFDALGLEQSIGTAETTDAEQRIREALAEVAGKELTDDDAPLDKSRANEYADEHTRSELYNACDALGLDVAWKDAKKVEMSEMLADESPGDVRAALAGEYDGDDE
jgi:hypothetical protein